MTDFNWPCSKRIAHGPHEAERPKMEPGPGNRLPVLRGSETYDCPGVKAHPNTMIGRPSNHELASPEKSMGTHDTEPVADPAPEPVELMEGTTPDFDWPSRVIQKLGHWTSSTLRPGAHVDLYAPLGPDGSDVLCTYKVVGWKGKKAMLERVKVHD